MSKESVKNNITREDLYNHVLDEIYAHPFGLKSNNPIIKEIYLMIEDHCWGVCRKGGCELYLDDRWEFKITVDISIKSMVDVPTRVNQIVDAFLAQIQ